MPRIFARPNHSVCQFQVHSRYEDPARCRFRPILVGGSCSWSRSPRRAVCLRCRRNENQHLRARQSDCDRTRPPTAPPLSPHLARSTRKISLLGHFLHLPRRVEPNAWLALEEQLREVARELSPAADALWGISTLLVHGIVCRCLAIHGRDALAGLHKLWRAAKFALYGTEAIPPRKVN